MSEDEKRIFGRGNIGDRKPTNLQTAGKLASAPPGSLRTNHGKRHELKTWPEYFAKIADGSKTFEIRLNDRDFRVDDFLLLREWEPHQKAYTGRTLRAKVTYLTTWQQKPGYVVMAFRKVAEDKVQR